MIKAREHGIVTSASLMVRGAAAEEAAAYARSHPEFSVGLHVDLGEWVWRDGEWATVYEVVSLRGRRGGRGGGRSASSRRFRVLVGREPTHLDSHQHVHTSGPGRGNTVPGGRRAAGAACGTPIPISATAVDLYGQTSRGEPMLDAISVANLIEILRQPRARDHGAWLPPR